MIKMDLTIWGAAQQVTGSMHLLAIDGYKILIDCGLDYEKGNQQEKNLFFPFNPSEIDVVILTHAHIDHSGNLPTLVRMGYKGQIICTAPTADLTEILLLDAVNLFLGKQKKADRNSRKRHSSGPQPLYLYKHVTETADRFITIGFNKAFKINKHVEITFIPMGHLLGAAAAVFKINDSGVEKTIAFTGDVGRKNYPVLVNPENLPPVDYLVCESTYGGRFHSNQNSLDDTLVNVINKTCIKSAGRLIIPAFSVGRTQSLIFKLNQIFSKGLLPPVEVFVDSPLANYATEIYRKHHNYVNDDAKAFYSTKGDEFDFDNLTYVQSQKESANISNYLNPCIIISSAGMLEGGRIQDHLYYNIQNYYCTILFIGYCAKGTLGEKLLRGEPTVRLRNKDLHVFAKIAKTDLLSGHGDHNDLMNLVKQQQANQIKKVFLVHGDEHSLTAFNAALKDEGYNAQIAEKGITYEL